ncbi:MAG: hypothetical protein UIH99_00415 [Alphaproteobacteria bacterium]|nr:hypothetical protein [Alphaproteobacteria bacterium]
MKKILISLLSVLYVVPTLAGKSDGAQWAKNWGVSGVFVCGGETPWEANNSGTTSPDPEDDVYKLYYVAHKIVEHGGYFCGTWVSASTGGIGDRTHTVYYAADDQNCLWLCEDGFYGEDCAYNSPTQCNETGVFPEGANATELISSGYLSEGGSNNIEENISMLFYDQYHNCSHLSSYLRDFKKMSSWPDQEHDVVLVIKGLGSGIKNDPVEGSEAKQSEVQNVTFTVMPLNVRAGKTKNCAGILREAWPVMGYVGTEKILCPDGWRLSSDKKKCEKVLNSEICDLEKLCQVTPRESYVKGMHSINGEASKYDQSCRSTETIFRCAMASQGFRAKDDFECIPCPGPKQGVAKNGVCITCDNGYIFDEEAKSCVQAGQLSQAALRVGRDRDDSKDLGAQCWIKDGPTEYRECILANPYKDPNAPAQ